MRLEAGLTLLCLNAFIKAKIDSLNGCPTIIQLMKKIAKEGLPMVPSHRTRIYVFIAVTFEFTCVTQINATRDNISWVSHVLPFSYYLTFY